MCQTFQFHETAIVSDAPHASNDRSTELVTIVTQEAVET